jgi:hypothetical protein
LKSGAGVYVRPATVPCAGCVVVVVTRSPSASAAGRSIVTGSSSRVVTVTAAAVGARFGMLANVHRVALASRPRATIHARNELPVAASRSALHARTRSIPSSMPFVSASMPTRPEGDRASRTLRSPCSDVANAPAYGASARIENVTSRCACSSVRTSAALTSCWRIRAPGPGLTPTLIAGERPFAHAPPAM